jgi:tetratricopeptide (TPR) repeat protein
LAEAVKADIDLWVTEARTALVRQDFSATEKYCRLIVNAFPQHADAHFLLAAIALETKQFAPAVNLLRRAISYDSDQAEYFALLARAYAAMHDSVAALSAADHVSEMPTADAVSLDTIGCIYSQAGLHKKAVKQFLRAVELSPNCAEFQYNLAVSSRFLGNFDLAEEAYEKAITLDPYFYKAHWSLAHLRNQSRSNNHIPRLEGLLSRLLDCNNANADAEVFLRCGLAKEFEDLEEYEPAFRHLSAGKLIARQKMDYSVAKDRELFEMVEHIFTADRLAEKLPGSSTEEPIFIVGMPRTGTTLVERVLTNHSAVFSAGELSVFGQQLRELSGSQSASVLDAATLRAGINIDPCMLGEAYLRHTRPYTGHTERFVDKMPLNFLYIGFINRSLPNARIICVRRNPMDTCLSNFRALFPREKATYYRYSYDLLETGRYYLMFDRLMRHWENVLPGKILQVNYEDVVANQEAESRRLIEFCGLDWEEACLHFEKNTAAVTTASSAQVRQPIYKNAVERWKHYEQQLQPLKELLLAGGLDIE